MNSVRNICYSIFLCGALSVCAKAYVSSESYLGVWCRIDTSTVDVMVRIQECPDHKGALLIQPLAAEEINFPSVILHIDNDNYLLVGIGHEFIAGFKKQNISTAARMLHEILRVAFDDHEVIVFLISEGDRKFKLHQLDGTYIDATFPVMTSELGNIKEFIYENRASVNYDLPTFTYVKTDSDVPQEQAERRNADGTRDERTDGIRFRESLIESGGAVESEEEPAADTE